jgi:hypothetical protein
LGQKQYSNQDFLYKTDSSIVVGVAAKPINQKVADYLLMKSQLQKEILFCAFAFSVEMLLIKKTVKIKKVIRKIRLIIVFLQLNLQIVF